MKTLALCKIVILISIFSLNCRSSSPSTILSQSNNNFLNCLNTKEQTRGAIHNIKGHDFQIEFPKNWYVDTSPLNGINGSDTLADLEDFNLITVTESYYRDFNFEKEYENLSNRLKENGSVNPTNSKVKVIQEGETEIAGNYAKWMLVEDEDVQKFLGNHARINYFFQVKNSDAFYIIANESYGDDKFQNLCELKKITNTFKYTNHTKFPEGKELYLTNCGSCHGLKMVDDLTGPALGGVTKKKSKEWLYDFTRNSIKMIEKGDKEAIQIFKEYETVGVKMGNFEYLTDKELKSIYDYIEEVYQKENEKK